MDSCPVCGQSLSGGNPVELQLHLNDCFSEQEKQSKIRSDGKSKKTAKDCNAKNYSGTSQKSSGGRLGDKKLSLVPGKESEDTERRAGIIQQYNEAKPLVAKKKQKAKARKTDASGLANVSATKRDKKKRKFAGSTFSNTSSEDDDLVPLVARPHKKRASKRRAGIPESKSSGTSASRSFGASSGPASVNVHAPNFECVICSRNLARFGLRARLTHLRSCAETYGIPIGSLRELVVNQTGANGAKEMFETSVNVFQQLAEKAALKKESGSGAKSRRKPSKSEVDAQSLIDCILGGKPPQPSKLVTGGNAFQSLMHSAQSQGTESKRKRTKQGAYTPITNALGKLLSTSSSIWGDALPATKPGPGQHPTSQGSSIDDKIVVALRAQVLDLDKSTALLAKHRCVLLSRLRAVEGTVSSCARTQFATKSSLQPLTPNSPPIACSEVVDTSMFSSSSSRSPAVSMWKVATGASLSLLNSVHLESDLLQENENRNSVSCSRQNELQFETELVKTSENVEGKSKPTLWPQETQTPCVAEDEQNSAPLEGRGVFPLSSGNDCNSSQQDFAHQIPGELSQDATGLLMDLLPSQTSNCSNQLTQAASSSVSHTKTTLCLEISQSDEEHFSTKDIVSSPIKSPLHCSPDVVDLTQTSFLPKSPRSSDDSCSPSLSPSLSPTRPRSPHSDATSASFVAFSAPAAPLSSLATGDAFLSPPDPPGPRNQAKLPSPGLADVDLHLLSIPELKQRMVHYGLKPKATKSAMIKSLAALGRRMLPAHRRLDPEETVGSLGALKGEKSRAKAAKKPDAEEIPRASIQEQICSFISSNDEVYVRVLLFEPLDLSMLHSALKTAGIKCSKKVLMACLDDQGVAFLQNTDVQKDSKTAKARARGNRGRNRQKLANPKIG